MVHHNVPQSEYLWVLKNDYDYVNSHKMKLYEYNKFYLNINKLDQQTGYFKTLNYSKILIFRVEKLNFMEYFVTNATIIFRYYPQR